MGDDITIGVTEIVNNIEVTAQPNDQIVDISVIDNADDVTLNITPTVIEINVNKGSSYAKWGTILGVLSDQTDLKNALDLKANLVGGKVPASELPSYVDDVVEVADYAALPTTGETGKIYVTLDNNKIYRWSGSIYIEIAANNAIWGAITGTLSNQTDLQSALNAKANISGQVFTGAISATNLSGTNTGDQTLSGLGGVPDSRNLTINGTTYDLTADRSWTITAGVWGQITGTLSNQTDLQAALDAKFDDPTGNTTQYIAGDGSLVTFPVAGQSGTLVREVRNTTGATLLKGTVVYISGATGNKATVSKALATSDATSAQTFGLLQADIPNNSNGYAVCVGDIIGLDTSAITEGTQLYLSSTTAGEYTTTKQVAPAHLVYVGVVTRSHPTLGQIEVKIQNGYELDEIHDVLITSKTNNDFLVYESASSLWKNKSLSTVLAGTSSQFVKGDGSLDSTSYTPTARTLTINGTAYDLSANRSWTIATHNPVGINVSNGLSIDSNQQLSLSLASAAASGALSTADWTTFNSKQTALNGTGIVRFSGVTPSYISGTNNQFVKGDGSLDSNTYITAAGANTFTNNVKFDNDIFLKQDSTLTNITGYTTVGADAGGVYLSPNSTKWAYLDMSSITTYRNYTLPDYTGTFILANSSGNVGIGTTSPRLPLEVFGNGFLLSYSTANASARDYAICTNYNAFGDFVINQANANGGNPYSAGTTRFYINASGNVGVGTTSPIARMHFTYTSAAGDALAMTNTNTNGRTWIVGDGAGVAAGNFGIYDSTGATLRLKIDSSGNVNIGTLGTGLVYSNSGTLTSTNPSDSRLKDNITDLEYGLNEVLQLRPVSYDWKNDTISQGKQFGFIAQEVQEVMPELVKEFATIEDEEEVVRLGLDKEGIYAALVNAIKEQNNVLEQLKAEIELLKAK